MKKRNTPGRNEERVTGNGIFFFISLGYIDIMILVPRLGPVILGNFDLS